VRAKMRAENARNPLVTSIRQERRRVCQSDLCLLEPHQMANAAQTRPLTDSQSRVLR
jgi:hypothetical protein